MSQRTEAVRERILSSGNDGFVSLAPPSNRYLTGFNGSTSAVIITESEARFLCDFRYTEQAKAQVGDGFLIDEATGGLPKRVGEVLAGLGLKRVAFEPASMTVAQRAAIEESYAKELAPSPGVVSSLRAVKTPDEIEKIRAAQSLAEGVLDEILDTLKEGVTEREVAARFEYEFKRRGASGASFDTIVLFGSHTSLPHGQPGDRRLEAGDAVLLDFGCCLDGYCSDLTRTYAFGRIPGAWFEEIYDLVLTAQQIALEAVRPGISCRELDAIARDLIEDAGHGGNFGHGLGHGVGIEVHEGPRLHREGEGNLEPGMVVTIEPGIYLPGRGGIRIEDLVAVDEEGCLNLTTASTELRILGL